MEAEDEGSHEAEDTGCQVDADRPGDGVADGAHGCDVAGQLSQLGGVALHLHDENDAAGKPQDACTSSGEVNVDW